jgi:hypothetical protein
VREEIIVVRKTLSLLLVLVILVGVFFFIRGRGASARAEAAALPLFVPVIVSPSIQPVNGQAVLYKATNITEAAVSVRLMLFNDRDGLPAKVQDFLNIPPGTTVTHLYAPPKGTLTLNETTVDVPEAVRAIFAPLPGDDPGAMRRVVANVQLMRLQSTSSASSPSLDPPIIVPLQRCNFEPRGFVPYTGGRWVWNCAPEMFPIPQN